MDEVIKEKKLARKKAVKERLNIIREINKIELNECSKCPIAQDKTSQYAIKCPKACSTGAFDKIRELGNKLTDSTKSKRVGVEEIEEEKEYTPTEERDYYVKCVKEFTIKTGKTFKIGETFFKSSENRKQRIVLQDAKGESHNISGHYFYNKFVRISKEESRLLSSEIKRPKYQVWKKFKTKDGEQFDIGGVWIMEQKLWADSRFKLVEENGREAVVARDTFYRNFEKIKEEK